MKHLLKPLLALAPIATMAAQRPNIIYIMTDQQTATALTSSLRTPKIFVKEFSYFLMPCHQHCLGVNLLVQR